MLAGAAPAAHAAPLGWNDPVDVVRPGAAAEARLTATAVAPDGSSRVAWTDASGVVSAVRVTADGRVGVPQVVATGQGTDVRGMQMVATDRDDVVLVWARGTTLRYAAAHLRDAFHGSRVLAHANYTSATPDIAALHGGTVAAIWRDYAYGSDDVVRYARRAPGRSFGAAHALRPGVYPQVEATPDGGAVVAMEVGPLGHRATLVGRARPGASVPSGFAAVPGRVRFHRLAASRRVRRVELLWTTRESTTRVRAREVWPDVGVTRDVPGAPHPATYEAPQFALGYAGEAVAAWPQYDQGFHDVVSRSVAGGPFDVPAPLETTAVGQTGVPQVLFDPVGGSAVLYARSREQAGPPVYDIVAADPATPAPAIAPVLGPTSSFAGLSGGYGGGAQVAAWPAGDGVSVAFRRG